MLLRMTLFLISLLLANLALAEKGIDISAYGTLAVGIADDDAINRKSRFTNKDYDDRWREDIDTRLGLQASAFYNEWRFTTQTTSAGDNDYDPELEWVYGSYMPTNELSVKIGRMRRSVYYYSDSLQVGYTYPWVYPPDAVYGGFSKNTDSIDGITFFYEKPFGKWNFSSEVYYGNYEDTLRVEGELTLETRFTLKDNVGITFSLTDDTITYHLGYHRSGSTTADITDNDQAELLINGLDAAGFNEVSDQLQIDTSRLEYYHVSIHVDKNNWLLNAEHAWMPQQKDFVLDQKLWYIMLGRRFGSWTSHLTYSEKNINSDNNFSEPIRDQIAFLETVAPGSPAIAQLTLLADGTDALTASYATDITRYTLGLRYDFKSPISIKAEAQHIEDEKNKLTNNAFVLALDFIFF